MKIVFLSNYLIHHQTEFCDTMVDYIEDGFKFIATAPIPQERLDLGYKNYAKDAPSYYIEASDEKDYAAIQQLVLDADAVIIGSAPWKYVEKRITLSKLTFVYSERIFKTISTAIKVILKGTFYQRYLYPGRYSHCVKLLCASAYLPKEMNLFHLFKDRMYRWGYFPPCMNNEIHKSKTGPLNILWAGRLIPYKRPIYAIKLAQILLNHNIPAHITIVGAGTLESHLHHVVEQRSLWNIIEFKGAIPPNAVRKEMDKADIFIFTSNSEEGWGAVLNEAMNSRCAVVVSDEIGSTPFLVKHKHNGMVFHNGKFHDFISCVLDVYNDSVLRGQLQENAYCTIHNTWNAREGAKRMIELVEALSMGKDSPYIDGPCSKII